MVLCLKCTGLLPKAREVAVAIAKTPQSLSPSCLVTPDITRFGVPLVSDKFSIVVCVVSGSDV
jgi:hypothetical protein